MRSFFLFWICFGLANEINSQLAGLDLLPKTGSAEIPFEIEQGFITIELWLKGILPLKMIFDTGAENTILFDKEVSSIMGVKFERQIAITGSNLDSLLVANIARNVDMKIANCPKVRRDIIVLEHNNLLINEKLGIDIHGILGGSFFSNLAVHVDYKKRVLRIQRSQDLHPDRRFKKFDINIDSHKPYLEAQIKLTDSSSVRVTLLIDTGAALPFLIHTNTDSNLVLPDKVMIGNVGFGLSGVIKGYLGNVKELRFGDFHFENIISSFQELYIDSLVVESVMRNGIIGNSLLMRFDMIIDYSKEKLYLKPYKKYNKSFEYDKSGITLFAVGPKLNQYYVVSVINDSPAHLAGIEPGDLIVKIGCRKTKNLKLEEIMDRLSGKEGKKIKMKIIRKDKEIKREFQLKSWYSL